MKKIKETINNDILDINDVYYYSLLSAICTELGESNDKTIKAIVKTIDKSLLMFERHFDSKYPNWDEVYEDIILSADDAMDKIEL